MSDDELFSVLSEIADEEIMAKNRASIVEVGQRIRRVALEEAANAIEPRNPPGDWTEYAKVRAEAAAAIRALSKDDK